jgi:hypothetical protein
LTFKALILETGTESYRLRTSRAGKRRTPPPPANDQLPTAKKDAEP